MLLWGPSSSGDYFMDTCTLYFVFPQCHLCQWSKQATTCLSRNSYTGICSYLLTVSIQHHLLPNNFILSVFGTYRMVSEIRHDLSNLSPSLWPVGARLATLSVIVSSVLSAIPWRSEVYMWSLRIRRLQGWRRRDRMGCWTASSGGKSLSYKSGQKEMRFYVM